MPFHLPVLTLTTAALGLWFIILTLNVIRLRGRFKVSLGDGGHEALNRAIRAQGNFIETVPVALIMLIVAELQGANALALQIAAAMLVAGRLAHGYAFGFTMHSPKLRPAGMALTFTAMIMLLVVLALQIRLG